MSAFPELRACARCEQRWPENVLDNFGVCPICSLPPEPVTCEWWMNITDYDGSRLSVECGHPAALRATYHDDMVANYPDPDEPGPYEGESMHVCLQHAAEMAEQEDREQLPEWITDLHFWTLDGAECSVLYERVLGDVP